MKKDINVDTHTFVCGVQTVELNDCEKTQALALQILLSLSKLNQHRMHEIDCYHGYSMIHQVLIKSKCIVGYHILKVSQTLCCPLFPRPLLMSALKHIPQRCFLPLISSSRHAGASRRCCEMTLLFPDPLDVSVIELCNGCVLKWTLSDLMQH